MRCAFCAYVLALGVCAVDKYANPVSYLCSFSTHYLPGQLNYISVSLSRTKQQRARSLGVQMGALNLLEIFKMSKKTVYLIGGQVPEDDITKLNNEINHSCDLQRAQGVNNRYIIGSH
jgi:hypothetical protein